MRALGPRALTFSGARVRALGPQALAFSGARLGALGPQALLGRRGRTLGVWAGAIVAWAVVAWPSVSVACAVCTAGRDEENQMAFLLSTVGMSLMPLVAIGTLVYVLWRRIQKLEAENARPTGRSTAPPAPRLGSEPDSNRA